MAVHIGTLAAQYHHRHCNHGEGIERPRIGDIGQLAHRKKCSAHRHHDPRQRGHDMRRMPARMHTAEKFRQQPVAAHHEENTRLREQQHENDRWQREEGCHAEHIAHARPADLAQHMRQRLIRADQRVGVCGQRALACEFFRPRGERYPARPHDRLAADGPDRTRRNEDVEQSAEQQRADQSERHVALRILGFLRRGRDRVEAHIGKEDRRRSADRPQT